MANQKQLEMFVESLEKAVELLKNDFYQNISFINFIKKNKITFLKFIESSVIAKGISDQEWVYLYCKTKEQLEELLKYSSDDLYYAVIEDWMLPVILKSRCIDWKLTTRKYILYDDGYFTVPRNEIFPLQKTDTDYIYEHSKYKQFLTREYIAERITKGISSCIRIENRLAGWIMTQDDGAIGFLTVLPEFQNRGFATDLIVSMISKIQTNNDIAFAYIEDNNQKAIALCEKLGFRKENQIHWLKLL